MPHINLRPQDDEGNNNRGRKHVIFINSREFVWNEKDIAFEDIIKLFYGSISNDPNIRYTVSYADGFPPQEDGDLASGQVIKVKNKMQFHVTHTGRS